MLSSIILLSDSVKVTGTHKDFDNWLRVMVLINYAGKVLFDDILHEKQKVTRKGAEIYEKLKNYENEMDYQIHKKILSPSDEIVDESKFDLMVYAAVVNLMFGNEDEYDNLIGDVIDMWTKIFHMKDVSICTVKFEQLWKDVCEMLTKHGFKKESDDVLRNLSSNKEYKGILDFFYNLINTNFISKPYKSRCIAKTALRKFFENC